MLLDFFRSIDSERSVHNWGNLAESEGSAIKCLPLTYGS